MSFSCMGCDKPQLDEPAGTFMGHPLCQRCHDSLRALFAACEANGITPVIADPTKH